MDRLSPELLHIVVLFLDQKDRLNFRLVSKNLSVIAGAHILPEVTFHLHEKDLAKLREIASNPVLARNVKSLTYFAARLESPAIPYNKYAYDHKQMCDYALIDDELAELRKWKLNLSHPEIKAQYEKYLKTVISQDALVANQMDRQCLKEILPSFFNLQLVTMSSDFEFYEARSERPKSVYAEYAREPYMNGSPRGVTQAEALLVSLAHHQMNIKEFRAGTMSWRFFDRESSALSRLFVPLNNLKYIDLVLEIETDENGNDVTDDTAKCRSVLQRGGLRDQLSSIPSLESLNVTVHGDWENHKPAASLNWIITEGQHWPNLSSVTLEGFDSTREDLWNFLELHKESLDDLGLGDVSLTKGSWKKLLPDIRSKLNLQEACFYGRLSGYREDPGGVPDGLDESDGSDDSDSLLTSVEVYNLWTPDSGPCDMRSSINCYCRRRGADYPNVLPLTKRVVRKYFDSHVRHTMGVISEAEDAEEMRKAEKETRARIRELNLFGIQYGADDSSSSYNSDSDFGEDDFYFHAGDQVVGIVSITDDETDSLYEMFQPEELGEEGSTEEEETAHIVASEELTHDDSEEDDDDDDDDNDNDDE